MKETIFAVVVGVVCVIVAGIVIGSWLDCRERGGTFVRTFPAPYTCIGGK